MKTRQQSLKATPELKMDYANYLNIMDVYDTKKNRAQCQGSGVCVKCVFSGTKSLRKSGFRG